MFIEERRKKILEMLDNKEKISNEEIMSLLNVSKSTVRRDLIDLESKKLGVFS
jgi:DeoR/GlpR family transcriptional regulator of sugar metabolism